MPKTLFLVALVVDDDDFFGAPGDGSKTGPQDVLNYLNIATQDEGIGPFVVWESVADMLADHEREGISAAMVTGDTMTDAECETAAKRAGWHQRDDGWWEHPAEGEGVSSARRVCEIEELRVGG